MASDGAFIMAIEAMDPENPAPEILNVTGLAAGYGGKRIIAGIDVTLKPGDVLGLLGANGSGKSTLLRAISGQIRPLSGAVQIGGIFLQQAPEIAKAQFGYAVEANDLPENLTGRQYLELVASIRSCPLRWPCGDLISRLQLKPWLHLPIRQYSMGTRAKISIAAAMLGAPKLLIFDESLNGLDPLAAWEVKRMILELTSSRRHAVIVSTHVAEAVPALCNRALFLAEGQIVQTWDRQSLADASRVPGAFEENVIRALNKFTA
jgi:ABC-2 type transport system ATP-binding protein